MENLKKVALNNLHESLGGKMVPFAGFNMPVRYTSDIAEHQQVRESVGVFDVSHMGEFILEGPKALELIQKVTTNDASKLFDNKVQYSCLPNTDGGIVDDLLVYRMNAEKFLLVVNASNIQKDWDWISAHNTFGVSMSDISDATSLLAVQGPKATQTLQKLTSVNLQDMGYYTFTVGTFASVENVIISATGYTGAGGFELYIPYEHTLAVWNAIFEAGKEFNIQPIGLGARDTLRLEMGFCLYGNDIDDTTSPIEAGLSWITKFTKDFINAPALKKQKEVGTQRRLIGFEMLEKGIPRKDYRILDANRNIIGRVTSGTMSPSLGKGIGMGYVDMPHGMPGEDIYIDVRSRLLQAMVVRPPFYKG